MLRLGLNPTLQVRQFVKVDFKGWEKELKSEITVENIDHDPLAVSWTANEDRPSGEKSDLSVKNFRSLTNNP